MGIEKLDLAVRPLMFAAACLPGLLLTLGLPPWKGTRSVCATCGKVLGFNPAGRDGVSHGLCRFDFLKSCEKGSIITPLEALELLVRRIFWRF